MLTTFAYSSEFVTFAAWSAALTVRVTPVFTAADVGLVRRAMGIADDTGCGVYFFASSTLAYCLSIHPHVNAPPIERSLESGQALACLPGRLVRVGNVAASRFAEVVVS